MDVKLLLLTLCTGLGLGFLALAVRQLAAVARLWVRGLLVTGVVTPRPLVKGDRRRTALVVFTDHLGRTIVFDPRAYGPLFGMPPTGGTVPVVYPRRRPTAARLWIPRHLLAPAFGGFLSSAVAFVAGNMLAR
ncbi:hypothetical protein ABT030_03220 [Streptomyces mirabilis]|uniref:hypothetical protein n=1 Tax=Streptomyces mirabilis TaxID=68239 RepID=UPI00332A4C57